MRDALAKALEDGHRPVTTGDRTVNPPGDQPAEVTALKIGAPLTFLALRLEHHSSELIEPKGASAGYFHAGAQGQTTTPVCQFSRTVHHHFVNPIAVLLSLVPARRITYADGPSPFGMLESLVCDARDPFMLGRQGYCVLCYRDRHLI
jgi:hypothetical protein